MYGGDERDPLTFSVNDLLSEYFYRDDIGFCWFYRKNVCLSLKAEFMYQELFFSVKTELCDIVRIFSFAIEKIDFLSR